MIAGRGAGGLDLIQHENAGASDYCGDAQKGSKNDSLEFEFGLARSSMVLSNASTHILPHDIKHGAGDQEIFSVEGVKQNVAFLEDLASCCVWAFTGAGPIT